MKFPKWALTLMASTVLMGGQLAKAQTSNKIDLEKFKTDNKYRQHEIKYFAEKSKDTSFVKKVFGEKLYKQATSMGGVKFKSWIQAYDPTKPIGYTDGKLENKYKKDGTLDEVRYRKDAKPDGYTAMQLVVTAYQADSDGLRNDDKPRHIYGMGITRIIQNGQINGSLNTTTGDLLEKRNLENGVTKFETAYSEAIPAAATLHNIMTVSTLKNDVEKGIQHFDLVATDSIRVGNNISGQRNEVHIATVKDQKGSVNLQSMDNSGYAVNAPHPDEQAQSRFDKVVNLINADFAENWGIFSRGHPVPSSGQINSFKVHLEDITLPEKLRPISVSPSKISAPVRSQGKQVPQVLGNPNQHRKHTHR